MRITGMLIAAALLAPGLCRADEAAPRSSSTIHLIVSAPADAAWSEQIARHVEECLCTPVTVTVQSDIRTPGTCAEACGNVATGATRAVTVCLDFGVPAPESACVAHAVMPDMACATVWADALKVSDLSPASDAAAHWLLRIEKQVTYAAGRLLGVPPCAMLLCVMHPTTSLHDVDEQAPNLCPPSREELSECLGLPH